MNLRGLKQKRVAIEAQQDITGKTILLTGRITKYTRITIERRILDLGGYIASKAGYNVDIVVYTKTDTAKFKTAKNISTSASRKILFVHGNDFVTDFLKLE